MSWGAAAPERDQLRLAEVIAALSLATDLANAFPPEKALRTALLAIHLGKALGLEGQDLSDTYYLPLLRFVGCTCFAWEEAAAVGGDDIALRNAFAPVDHGRPSEMVRTVLTAVGKGAKPVRRVQMVGRFLAQGKGTARAMAVANCAIGVRFAQRLGMSPGVTRGLNEIHERWDGKGVPVGIRGEDISLPARILQLAHVVEIHHRIAGRDDTVEMVRRRRGGQFDPTVVDSFLGDAGGAFGRLEEDSAWDAVLESEPEPRPWIPPSRLDAVAEAFADFVDLKSPYLLGHSSGVAALATAAGRLYSLTDADLKLVRNAALLHDLGRVSVPNGIWDKPGPLSSSEWERVRLHPYYSERVLSASPVLSPLATVAGMHHERLDGAGYHRGAPAALQSAPARLLAAADVFHALSEPRPHRPPLPLDRARREFEGEIAAGRLDREAAGAVLAAAGQKSRIPRQSWPRGLTKREVEVLRLLARGSSRRQIADQLFISDATVHTHVLHIYEKVGVSSRAAVALFAVENDLIRA
jgi:HD-GYP domain-containing protein (c-di-GMP phosphodiesterase class II)/DNA-binding CsgD family transcriptional regulator